MVEIDIKTKKDAELEKLVATLKKNKLAMSDSEARRMAEEMLSTSKRVTEDFSEREKKIFGEQKKDSEVELAHKQVEQLTANIGKGKSDVRIDIEGVDVNKPLKDIVEAGEQKPVEKEDTEVAVEVDEPEPSEPKFEPEPEPKAIPEEPGEEPEAESEAESKEPEEAKEREDSELDEEPAKEEPKSEAEPEEPDEEPVEEEPESELEPKPDEESESKDDDSGMDVEVKELDESDKPKKSEEERKKEIDDMPESKIDLADVFKSNK